MKHLNRYNSFLQIREGLEKGLEKFIHLKKFFKLLGKTEGDDLAKSLSRLADNLGDDAALKLEQLMGKVITGKNAREIDGKYNLISERGVKYSLETINMIIDAILTGKKTYEEVRRGLPSVLSDGLEFKQELETILKSRKPKAASTKIKTAAEEGGLSKGRKPKAASTNIKPAAEEGALPPKSTDDFIIGQKKIPLTEEQVTQTFQDQQDVYNKLENLEDWSRLKGVLEKVDTKQDVLNQLEKIGFGPDTAVRSKAFIEAIGEKNLVSFWNDLVVMKDSFRDMNQVELMKLIEQRMSRIETKAIGGSEETKKNAWSKLKFPDRKRRSKIWKWMRYTGLLLGIAFFMYKCSTEDEEQGAEESGSDSDGNSEFREEGGNKRQTPLKKRKKQGGGSKLPKLLQDTIKNEKLPEIKHGEATVTTEDTPEDSAPEVSTEDEFENEKSAQPNFQQNP